jgi:hypothetical protein
MKAFKNISLNLSIYLLLGVLFSGCFISKDITYSTIEVNERNAKGGVLGLINNQVVTLKNEKRFAISYELEVKTRQEKGYSIEMITGEKSFQIWATPNEYKKTGTISFYADSDDGDIHGADRQGEKASNNDPVVKQVPVDWKELFKQHK